MIWAGIRADGQLFWCFFNEFYEDGHHTANASAYCKLLHQFIPQMMIPGHGFLQDNAPIHSADISNDQLYQLGVWVIPLPPYSPDLNYIEHL